MKGQAIAALQHDPGPLAGAMKLFDDRFGPLTHFQGYLLTDPDPPWWLYTCSLARVPAGEWFQAYPAGAAGTSISGTVALRRCLGEAVERYCGLYSIQYERLTLNRLGISPWYRFFPRCASFEPCDELHKNYSPDQVVDHCELKHLRDDSLNLLPASMVHLGFKPQGESLIWPPISTGLAYHVEISEAIWAALCEIVERDALMLCWQLQVNCPQVDISSAVVPEDLALRNLYLQRSGLHCRLFDITDNDFGICVVLCVLSSTSWPYFVVGAAANADPGKACNKAVDEAISVRIFVKTQNYSIGGTDDFGWVRQLESHAILYANWKDTPAFDFLLKAPTIPWEEFSARRKVLPPKNMQELKVVGDQLSAKGLDVFWKEITTPDIWSVGHVVRVLIPQAVPLSQSMATRWLATPRLTSKVYSEAVHFNVFPHPFA